MTTHIPWRVSVRIFALIVWMFTAPAVVRGQGCDMTRWTRMSFDPEGRGGAAMAYDSARRRVILFGGTPTVADNSVLLADTWEFDGEQWTRRTTANSPPGRTGGVMAYDAARRKTVLVGGVVGDAAVADTWEYDGTNWTQRMTAVSPTSYSCMAYDAGRQRLVLFVGFRWVNGAPVYLSETWEYDGSNWMQRTPLSTPPPRSGATAVYDAARGRVVLFGGSRLINSQFQYFSDTWEYDGITWTQRTTAQAPSGRAGATMDFNPVTGKVVLFGGITSTNENFYFSDTWEYDGENWVLRADSAAPPARITTMVFNAATGRFVLFGGYSYINATFTHFADTWEHDGTNWSLRSAPTPPNRIQSAMAYNASIGRVVLFGGQPLNYPEVSFSDTWEHDGVAWVQRAPVTSVPGRSGARLAYHAGSGKLVLFGGTNTGVPFADTWEYNGTDWTQRFPADAPSARSEPAMAYHSLTGRIVLFGGRSANASALSDTWEYDGANWIRRVTNTSPPARWGCGMAENVATGKIVLFIGNADQGTTETWEYDGTNWRRIVTATSPSPRTACAMAYDATTGKVVLFGGVAYPNGHYVFYPDTWEYDGVNWTLRSNLATPSGRIHAPLTFNPTIGRVTLFGGVGSGVLSDTWTYGHGPLTIRRDPIGNRPSRGSYVDLSVVADGLAPLSFRWKRNGVILTDTGNTAGSNSNVLQIRTMSVAEVGTYSCTVTDACNVSVDSATAEITLCLADFDGDGHVKVADIFEFLHRWFAGDVSADIDGGGLGIADIFAFLDTWFEGC